jgi:8-oxo-dGTP pyrophosphatase MutT (NUDIX family)
MEPKNKELHRIVATCIIHKDGKYLITRRSLDKRAWPGLWTVPGGGLNVDDYINEKANSHGVWYNALEKTLRRELLEEVGLEVGKIDYLLDMTFIRPDNVPVITLSFHAPWKSGDVKLNEESIDHAWASYEETKKFDLIGGILEEIEMVDKILKG